MMTKKNSLLVLITLDRVSCNGETNLWSLSIREMFAAAYEMPEFKKRHATVRTV